MSSSHARPMSSPSFQSSHLCSPLSCLCVVHWSFRTRARAQRFGKTVLRKQSITLEDLELVVALALPPSGHRSAEKGRILVPQGHGPLLHVELHRARLPAAERKGRLARPRRHTRADSAPRRPVSLLRALAWAPRSRHNRPSQSRQSCARRGRPRPWWPHRATLPPCMRWQMPAGRAVIPLLSVSSVLASRP